MSAADQIACTTCLKSWCVCPLSAERAAPPAALVGMMAEALVEVDRIGSQCRCGYSPCGCGRRCEDAVYDALAAYRTWKEGLPK